MLLKQKTISRRNVIELVLLGLAAFSAILYGLVVFNKPGLDKKFTKVDQQAELNPLLTPLPTTTTFSPSPHPQPYTVTIITASDVTESAYHHLRVTYKVKIANVSIKPYITNFALYQCLLSDSNNRKYQENIMTETSFDKAILPGTSREVTISDDFESSGKACNRGSDGIEHCTLLPRSRVQNCTAYVTSNNTQASREWGSNPIQVLFPNSSK